MSKTIKLLAVLLIAVVVLSMTSTVFAENGLEPGSITASYDNVDSSKVQNIAGNILGWIRNIAAIASVILLAVLGIKFMLGSTEERAEYKKSFLPLIIGLFVVLSATTIAGWIWSALNVAD